MQRGVHKNGLLFTERVFGWTVVDYTDYRSFECTIYAIRYVSILASNHKRLKIMLHQLQQYIVEFFIICRTFVTTPILCKILLMHDCMLAIIGGLSTVAADTTIVSI